MTSIISMSDEEIVIATYHIFGVLVSEMLLIVSVTPEKLGFPAMRGASVTTAASAVLIDVLTTTFVL
jgi:hypothetical protein